MSPLKVLHVIEAMHQGGAESLVIEHVRHAGPGVESLVCALNRGGPALEEARAAGAKIFLFQKGESRMAAIRRLAALIRSEGVSVVNGHNPTGGLYGAAAGVMARVPLVVRTEHSIHHPGRHSGIYPWLIEPITTALARRVVCVCEAARVSHVRRMPWARRRFVTILNGISAAPSIRSREKARSDLGLEPDDRVALTVGSLTSQKAQHVLLDAFIAVSKRLPRARLLIAGEGPLRVALETQARHLFPAGKIRFLGPRNDVAELLEAADLFVLSSVREGLSVTLLEAMRAARPAVATRIGGNPEAVVDGETGLIVPPEDPAALGAAMAFLLEDEKRAEAYGQTGWERWMRCFTAERMVRETEALYRTVLAERPVSTHRPVSETRVRAAGGNGGRAPDEKMPAVPADVLGVRNTMTQTPVAETVHDREGAARRAFESFARWTIEEEPARASEFLPEEECRAFLDYYASLPKPGDETSIRRYLRGLWRSEAGWTARWIASRPAGRPVRVLDAGSGFGTYSMLFAAVGAEVTGVDLRPDRLDAAERRLAHYRERRGVDLRVRYERADLTRGWPDDFDLVWVYNALSHIDPLDDFLRGVRQHLRPGGVLVVGDINGGHPAHLRRLEAVRSEIHQEYVAPDGVRHAYAVERPFPPGELREIMDAQGLRVVHHEVYLLGLARLSDPFYLGLVRPLQRWWRLGARIGRRQLLVAASAPVVMAATAAVEDESAPGAVVRRA